MTPHKVLLPARPTVWKIAMPAGAARFDYPAAPVGKVGHASVYYDTTLGQAGLVLAQQIYHMLPQAIVKCELYFGQPVRDFNVIVAALNAEHDGLGGAYHYGCDFTTGRTLYIDAALGNPTLTLGLVVAELTECQMGLAGTGWDCGASNGEALSRFLATLLSGGPRGALAPYASAPAWDQAGRPNWISRTDPTDTNFVSTGCGVLYLWWMMSGKTPKGISYSPSQITHAGGQTLADNYHRLTGGTFAWADFSAAVSHIPVGSITSDDPWETSLCHRR